MTIDADAQYQHALLLKNESQYEQAASLFIALANQYAQNAHPLQQANCYLEAGEAYYYIAQYETAIAVFEQLLTLLEQLPEEILLKADTYENLGICYGEQGNRQEEIVYKQQSLQLRRQVLRDDDESIAQSYNNLGYAYERVGDCQQALVHFKQALLIFEQHPLAQKYLAICYNNIGNCYSAMGDYNNALTYHAEALRSRRNMPDTLPTQMWVTLNNIGFDYMFQDRYAQSEAYFSEALTVAQQIWQEQPNRQIATVRNNLGVCYRKQKQYEKAIIEHQSALQILRQLPDDMLPQQMANLCNLGEIQMEQQQYDQAVSYFLDALQIADSMTSDTPYKAIAHTGIGTCRNQTQQLEEALFHYQQALCCLKISAVTDNKYPNQLHQIPTAESPIFSIDTYRDPKALMAIWKGKIETLCQLYHQTILRDKQTTLIDVQTPISQEKTSIQPPVTSTELHLTTALITCRQALHYLNQLRRSYQAEEAKIQLTEKAFGICEQALHIIFELYQYQPNDDLLAEAFAIAEQGKALSLLSNLKHAEAKQTANLNPVLLEEEQQIRAELHALDRYLRQENQKGSKANLGLIKEWQTRYFAYQERYTRLIDQLEATYPDYYQLKYATDTVAVADIQQFLATKKHPNSLISYFTGEREIFVFYISPNTYIARRYSKSPTLSEQINTLLRAIKTIDKRTYSQTAYALYQTLALSELLPSADHHQEATDSLFDKTKEFSPPHLLIIPDRELLYLPFDALLCEPVQNMAIPYQNMPYIVYRYALSYHYSATLWLQTNTAHQREASSAEGFMGVAPIHFHRNEQQTMFRSLTSSEKTLSTLATLFHQRQLNGQIQIGAAATWINFKQQAAIYRYLLLYTHAELNETQPALSRILFAHDTNSGDCYMADTYALSLQADLVVLGACETGMGELKKGEGMIGINRGFLYAGATNLVFSLIKVPEQPASQLLILFFDKMLYQNTSYAEALQHAKCQLLQQQANVPPLAWAGWVLLGVDSIK